MGDISELRKAIQSKLEHRRELMRLLPQIRAELGRAQQRNKFLLETLGNPLVNMTLEAQADEIVQAVLDEAIRASEVIADQHMFKPGTYEIGISIPSLHIRRYLHIEELRSVADGAVRDEKIQRITN